MGRPNDDEAALRRFVACRDAGDEAGADLAWRELVELSLDRITNLVDAWAWRKAPLDDHERADAIAEAIFRMWHKVRTTYEGTSMGELHNLLERLVGFACSDVVRAAVKHRRREKPLDATWTDEEGDVQDASSYEVTESQAKHVRDLQKDEARHDVDWALARMTNARYREAIEDGLDGVPAEETAARMGVTIDNLYQLRRRGLVALRALLQEHQDS